MGSEMCIRDSLSGFLADRISRKLILAGGLTLWAVATIASGFVQTYGEFVAARALLGLGKGSLVPVAVTLVTQSFPASQRGKALGVFFVGVSIGPGAGISVAGMIYEAAQAAQLAGNVLLADIAPWRVVFLALALPAMVLIAAVYWVSDPRNNSSDQADKAEQESEMIGAKSGLLYAAIFAGLIMISFTDNAAIGWIPAVYSREFGFSIADAGTVFAIVAIVGGSIGPLAGGWAGDRVYRRWGADGRLAACSAAAGLLAILYLFFLSGSAAILVAGLFLIAILITGVGTVGMVVIQEVLPDRIRGLGTGLTYSFGMVIAGNGPTAVAMVNEWAYSGQATSTAVATVCSPTALTAAAFLALAVVLHRRQATDRSGAALSP